MDAVFPNYERGGSLPMGTKEIKPIGGMSLRDYFASKAMAAILPMHSNMQLVAVLAYQIADEMLKERA
jgi:hypothetical protein